MWTERADWVGLVGSCVIALLVLGCGREIGDITVEASSTQGCLPLQVELVAQAEIQELVTPSYRWVIENGVELHGERVTYTFTTAGTYEVALTVASNKQRKSKTTTIEVREAELPSLPGVYLRRGCQYQSLPQATVQSIVKSLGKTSLEDLEKYVVGRSLSTSELVTHPQWRRDHTHTVRLLADNQFIRIDLEQFLTLGFVAMGKEVHKVALLQVLPSSEPRPEADRNVVIQVVDSWDIANVTPEVKGLRRQPLSPQVVHYTPDEKLVAGRYLIEFQAEGQKTPSLSPIELMNHSN